MTIYDDITDLIGRTPLVRLKRIPEPSSAEILAKCEHLNPGGSVKDRMAIHILRKAEEEGKLRPGTPSIGDGVRTPCQWIELGAESRLVTASVMVSPSRQRKIGAGIWPLMPVPVMARPVTFIGTGPISS